MSDKDIILVSTSDTIVTRRRGPKELNVEVLAKNVNLFLTQIESILEKAPDTVSKFQFAEFTISAEISAKGQLVLLGAGGEAGATGGVTFTFKKVSVASNQ
jgi:hypothetical protein